MKIAVASAPYPNSMADGLHWIEVLSADAANQSANLICFPETYLPGYPNFERSPASATEEELKEALQAVSDIAKKNAIAIIIPMDWYEAGNKMNVAQVVSATGEVLGYQTKNQLDPSEDEIWIPGTKRHLFEINGIKFGIVICHEGFRYPESVRWAARQGAQIVFHPHLTGGDEQGNELLQWGSRENPYYEKAQMARALENTIYFAPSNYALKYAESASAIIAPDGSCVAYQQDRGPGVVVAEVDLSVATGLLARRFKPEVYLS
jgi:predicted amidohydrolase